MFVEKKLQKNPFLPVACIAGGRCRGRGGLACSKIPARERFVFYRAVPFCVLILYSFIYFLISQKTNQMKKFQQLGRQLSKEEAQNVNGGISISCRSVNGVRSCTIRCANGKVITVNGCGSCSAFSSSVNGVLTEYAVCCGTTYNC